MTDYTVPHATIPMPLTDTAVVFRVDGTPVSWKRPRQGKRGGRYTDHAAAAWTTTIATTIDQALRAAGHFTRPVYGRDEACALEIVAAFPRPRTASRPLPTHGYADVDNLAKAAMDAAQAGARGILYADDAQVAHLTTAKAYVDGAGFLEVTVYDVTAADTDRDPVR